MAGKTCPQCKEQTFFQTTNGGRECSKCGYKMMPQVGSGGKGQKCTNCNKFTVRDGRCTNCGVTYGF